MKKLFNLLFPRKKKTEDEKKDILAELEKKLSSSSPPKRMDNVRGSRFRRMRTK